MPRHVHPVALRHVAARRQGTSGTVAGRQVSEALRDLTAPDPRQLADSRDRLRDACRDLIDPQTTEIVRDDQTTTRHVGPSLMAQLRAAIATGGESAMGSRSRGRPLVIVASAHDLLAAIVYDVAAWPWCERGSTEDRIRGCVATLARGVDLDAIRFVDRHLTAWSADIRALLNPGPRRHLAAPCPACGYRMAWVRDPGTGERVQVHALQVAMSSNSEGLQCTCLACATVWPESHFELLAAVLT